MTTRKRRERDREKMKRRILDAAKQLFVKEGFENVSLRRIAAAIEYSPAAIYRYFKNKREILSVLRHEGFKHFVVQQDIRKEEYPDPVERLLVGGREYIKFALGEPEYYQLMFSSNCDMVDLDGEWAETSMQSYENFRSNVAECVEAGHFGDVNVDTVVFALWSGVHGMAHLISTGQVDILTNDIDVDDLLQSILAFNLRPGVKN